MTSTANITIERLKEVVSYDPETGLFQRKTSWGRRRPGDPIGGTDKSTGYIYIYVDNTKIWGHRAAWAIMTGAWPKHQIDHKDHVRHNNVWINLREATKAENMQNATLRNNNTSGKKGVRWNKPNRKWIASIFIGGVNKHLGCFPDIDSAAAAYSKAAKELFGEFAFIP